MIIFGLEITASRWPWQDGYNWRGVKRLAPLNAGGARFGGGWKYKLGIDIGGSTVIVNLLFGLVSVSPARKCTHCKKYIPRKEKSGVGFMHEDWPMHESCAQVREAQGDGWDRRYYRDEEKEKLSF